MNSKKLSTVKNGESLWAKCTKGGQVKMELKKRAARASIAKSMGKLHVTSYKSS